MTTDEIKTKLREIEHELRSARGDPHVEAALEKLLDLIATLSRGVETYVRD